MIAEQFSSWKYLRKHSWALKKFVENFRKNSRRHFSSLECSAIFFQFFFQIFSARKKFWKFFDMKIWFWVLADRGSSLLNKHPFGRYLLFCNLIRPNQPIKRRRKNGNYCVIKKYKKKHLILVSTYIHTNQGHNSQTVWNKVDHKRFCPSIKLRIYISLPGIDLYRPCICEHRQIFSFPFDYDCKISLFPPFIYFFI